MSWLMYFSDTLLLLSHCSVASIDQGINLDLLQDSIITQAEVMELKGDPKGSVEGYVIESKTDTKRG